jgi:hypothetical protein
MFDARLEFRKTAQSPPLKPAIRFSSAKGHMAPVADHLHNVVLQFGSGHFACLHAHASPASVAINSKRNGVVELGLAAARGRLALLPRRWPALLFRPDRQAHVFCAVFAGLDPSIQPVLNAIDVERAGIFGVAVIPLAGVLEQRAAVRLPLLVSIRAQSSCRHLN